LPFTEAQCTHDPVIATTGPMKGKRVSPYRDFGRGLEGALVCDTCGQVVENPKQPVRSQADRGGD